MGGRQHPPLALLMRQPTCCAWVISVATPIALMPAVRSPRSTRLRVESFGQGSRAVRQPPSSTCDCGMYSGYMYGMLWPVWTRVHVIMFSVQGSQALQRYQGLEQQACSHSVVHAAAACRCIPGKARILICLLESGEPGQGDQGIWLKDALPVTNSSTSSNVFVLLILDIWCSVAALGTAHCKT
jgi:hypothetical protein